MSPIPVTSLFNLHVTSGPWDPEMVLIVTWWCHVLSGSCGLVLLCGALTWTDSE
jgi:hypothetical protein